MKSYIKFFILLLIALLPLSCSNSTGSDTNKDGDKDTSFYIVTFNSRGGTKVDSQIVDSGNVAEKPIPPEKNAYIFSGWFSDTTDEEKWDFSENIIVSDTTLTAKWVQKSTQYVVAFDSKGGSYIDTQLVKSGKTVAVPQPPKKDKSTFSGWYSDSTYERQWNFSNDIIQSDTTLYAKWETNIEYFYVAFDTKGGTLIDTQYIAQGKTASTPTIPTKNGFTFSGWYSDSAYKKQWNFPNDIIQSDTTLYAKWETNTEYYYVAFDTKGGTLIDTQYIESGKTASTPTIPTKSSFTFSGWYSDSAYEKQWNFSEDPILSDTTLHAKWKSNITSDSAMVLVYSVTKNDFGKREIQLPLGNNGSKVDVTIDWGDGETVKVSKAGTHKHIYTADGDYKVQIIGSLEHFGYPAYAHYENKNTITEVQSFGNLGITKLTKAFIYCKVSKLPPLPSSITDLSYSFYLGENAPSDISNWNTSNVTNMEGMFMKNKKFNVNISKWNTSNVTNMSSMFCEAKAFNQPIHNWNTQNVTTMESMFSSATSFNQPINNWNTQNVNSMAYMFSSAIVFNQDINSWNTQNVTTMRYMFANAYQFNQSLENWNTAKVTSLVSTFASAYRFNKPIGSWNTQNVTDMSSTFSGATSFNQDLSGWNTHNVTTMSHMFNAASKFNENISSWDTKKVTNMNNMFMSAASFNNPIGNWNTTNVTSMTGMFKYAESFNQPIGDWDVSNVLSMRIMFEEAKSFNQDCAEWNVHEHCDHSNFDYKATTWKDKFKPHFN